MPNQASIMTIELRKGSFQNIELLLEFMAEFNRGESIAFDAEIYRSRLKTAFEFPQFVKTWLIVESSVPIGYAVLTWTFSFEFDGIQAKLDELYLCPAARGKGLGTPVLAALEREARNSGANNLWADVSDTKPGLFRFYERYGFNYYPYRPYRKPL